MSELVSIITPSYNSAAYIAEMIESILAQTYTNWELLITDDCSTDDSVKIIESYATKDSRIKLFRLASNSGAGIARNKSIEEARGRYIAFCDSDDLWKPQKLEKQVEFMQKTDMSSYIVNRRHRYRGKRHSDQQPGTACFLFQHDYCKFYRNFIRDIRYPANRQNLHERRPETSRLASLDRYSATYPTCLLYSRKDEFLAYRE